MMSRSGWSKWDCDYDNWAMIRACGAQKSAIEGKRGQSMLRDLATALDAMPVKELASGTWAEIDGPACALGVLGRARGLESEMSALDPDNDQSAEKVAQMLRISPTLARLIVWENDEGLYLNETPAMRWQRIRKWVDRHIKVEPASPNEPAQRESDR